MDILSPKPTPRQEKSCIDCGSLFLPGTKRQKRCLPCVHKPCIDCGGKKEPRGPRCRRCAITHLITNPPKRKNRKERSLEQVISEAEAIGLLPEKQYAFGYVIGVVFGDGSAFPVTSRIPHTRSNGTIAYHDSTVYRVSLQVISQTFAERFASQWGILTGKSTRIRASIRTNFSKSTLPGRREGYSIQLFTVNPKHVLFGRYLAYLKHDSELYELLRFPSEVMRGIIHGMIDSEGTATSNRRISIANMRVTLLDVLALMAELLGYKAIVTTYPSGSISYMFVYDMPYSKFGL